MYEHISLIYNPYAGGLRGAKLGRLDLVERILEEQGRRVTRHVTQGPKTAGNVARECLSGGSDLIVIAGGDGTVNEVAGGLIGSQLPMAVLPAGTANVLANEIGVGRGMERAARAIAECVPCQVPVGVLTFANGACQRFLLMAGAGLDAAIVYGLNPGWKARLGKAAYWLGSTPLFWRKLEEFDVECDGLSHACSFALISKVRNYGGDFEIARQVRIVEREFEVVLFAGSNTFRYFVYFGGVATGRLSKVPGVMTYRARELRLTPRNGGTVHCQVDGEYAGTLPVTVSSGQRTVTLLIPKRYLSQ